MTQTTITPLRDWAHHRAPTLQLQRGPLASGAIASTDDALTYDDVVRLQTTARWGAATALAVAVAIQFIGNDPIAIALHTGGLLIALAVCLYIVATVRTVADFRGNMTIVLGLTGALATASGFYFWGPFSAASIAVPAAAMLLTQSRRTSKGVLWIAVSYQGGHLAVGLLVVLGALQDRALTPIGPHSTSTHLGRLFLIQLILTATFAVARRIRARRQEAMEELDHVVKALGRREALLDEAQRQRDAARQLNTPGAYTNQIIAGYRLGVIIGRGACGVVYDATSDQTGERAAVKLLHPHVLARPEQYRRFAREVRTAASLSSPHLVRVVALPDDGDGFPFLAMERLVGQSLSDYLDNTDAMPVDAVVDLVRQVGAGLRAAHRAGIVHRDLKPSNVFRLDAPVRGVQWKILDFGTSMSTATDCEMSLTALGGLIGTPAYMAPEQARGARVDDRADLYALGAIAYRALTGRPAFAAASLPELLHAVVYNAAPRPTDLRSLPVDVDRVLALALAKRPHDRFGTGTELADALGAASRGALAREFRDRADEIIVELGWAPISRCA